MENKQIVIDACIARSAGNTDHPISRSCREFIRAFVIDTRNILVFTEEIKQEWNKHESKLSKKLRFILRRKGRIKILSSYKNPELRDKVRTIRDKDRISAILKDVFLVEAALKTDNCIISKDKKARNNFAFIIDKFRDLKYLIWLNPVDDKINLVDWLLNGCNKSEVDTLDCYC